MGGRVSGVGGGPRALEPGPRGVGLSPATGRGVELTHSGCTGLSLKNKDNVYFTKLSSSVFFGIPFRRCSPVFPKCPTLSHQMPASLSYDCPCNHLSLLVWMLQVTGTCVSGSPRCHVAHSQASTMSE